MVILTPWTLLRLVPWEQNSKTTIVPTSLLKDVIALSSGGNGKPSPKKSPLVSKAGDGVYAHFWCLTLLNLYCCSDTTAGPSKLLNANDDDNIINVRVDQGPQRAA